MLFCIKEIDILNCPSICSSEILRGDTKELAHVELKAGLHAAVCHPDLILSFLIVAKVRKKKTFKFIFVKFYDLNRTIQRISPIGFIWMETPRDSVHRYKSLDGKTSHHNLVKERKGLRPMLHKNWRTKTHKSVALQQMLVKKIRG